MIHPQSTRTEPKRSIVILDFGGQYAHLIGTRVRQLGAYSQILPPETPAEDMEDAAGIILSGGPQSVYDSGSPQADPKILELGIPVLGLCYGLHWITQTLGGEVKAGTVKEYGHRMIQVMDGGGTLLKDFGPEFNVWMSHGDEAVKLPKGFTRIATSSTCANAAFADEKRKIFALQFHAEVTHTEHGLEILKRFVDLCDAAPWSIQSYAKRIGEEIQKEVDNQPSPAAAGLRPASKVFMLVSGGVDSTVAFTLLNEVLGKDRVQGLMVDTGLMRKGEVEQIRSAFKNLGITNLHIEEASEEFFKALEGLTDPEAKRKAIGNTFLSVQKRVLEQIGIGSGLQATSYKLSDWLLGQGTIYPDTIETGGTKHADHIKTHHNRVEAIAKMIEQGLVIEPLKDLYKDEVRKLGEEIGLPHELVWRHPFPGPGLGVRILCSDGKDLGQRTEDLGIHIDIEHAILPIKSVGVQGDGRTYRHALVLFSDHSVEVTKEHRRLATEIPNKNRDINRVLVCVSQSEKAEMVLTPMTITRERADLLREADAIVDEEMRRANLYEQIWQFPVVLLPVGVKKGGQSHLRQGYGGQAIVLRPVESTEAMTANAAPLSVDVLTRMTERILKLPGIDLVFYDLTSKPPGTIEWE